LFPPPTTGTPLCEHGCVHRGGRPARCPRLPLFDDTIMSPARISHHRFVGVSALIFTASTAVTIVWYGSMSALGGMTMPGGWSMSMAWMPMPGQTWVSAAATFLGMWVAMMVAMKLPSLVPVLKRYREAVGTPAGARLDWLTALVGLAYFSVWTLLGMAAFPLGAVLAALEMREPALAHAVPFAVAMVVMLAGALQFSRWKAHHLACYRQPCGCELPADAGSAWRHGVRLALHCSACCAGLMAILMVVGVMDIGTMIVVAVAITAERLAPKGQRVARLTGAVAVLAGCIMLARAALPG
jgi:predicted metal-binding membrane protein